MPIKITINDQEYAFDTQKSILHAAKEVGIKIPTLCYMKELAPNGACRMCLVEVEGFPRPVPSCNMAIKDGMKVWTNTFKIRQIRKTLIELLIANHPKECLTCVMNQHCELQTLAQEYGIRDERYAGEIRHNELDLTSPSLVRDPDKCILCGRCVRVCDQIQSVHAIDFTKRGFYTIVISEYNKTIDASNCVLCGACVRACPTGALKEKSAAAEVFEAI
ncbi:MAG: 4Fe-4S binding protein, partial [Candidatus Lokiarchaeota archaeon]|nr:4Fe-4S binding protein [Candidatus Lokiarchaeota archaeon]